MPLILSRSEKNRHLTDEVCHFFLLWLSIDERTTHQRVALCQKDIGDVLRSFLAKCGIEFVVVPYDHIFHNLCYDNALENGYAEETLAQLLPFLPGGVIMACTAYAHLPCQSTREFIAWYTTILIYLDDMFQERVEIVAEFNERFTRNEPQGNSVLDLFSSLLREMPSRFGRVQSNIMVTSTLNLVTALLLEHGIQQSVSSLLYS
jgi:hypothetical protein